MSEPHAGDNVRRAVQSAQQGAWDNVFNRLNELETIDRRRKKDLAILQNQVAVMQEVIKGLNIALDLFAGARDELLDCGVLLKKQVKELNDKVEDLFKNSDAKEGG